MTTDRRTKVELARGSGINTTQIGDALNAAIDKLVATLDNVRSATSTTSTTTLHTRQP